MRVTASIVTTIAISSANRLKCFECDMPSILTIEKHIVDLSDLNNDDDNKINLSADSIERDQALSV